MSTNKTYTIRVQKDFESDEYLEMTVRELDAPIYSAARALFSRDKDIEAAKFLIENLRIGGCEASVITGDFRRLQAAIYPLTQLLTPWDGELKKN